MKTRGGVYIDLKESEYKLQVANYTFVFSSKIYCEKFKNGYNQFIEQENLKFNSKYGINCNLFVYLLFAYYKKIEKRGFLVYDEQLNKEITDNTKFLLYFV